MTAKKTVAQKAPVTQSADKPKRIRKPISKPTPIATSTPKPAPPVEAKKELAGWERQKQNILNHFPHLTARDVNFAEYQREIMLVSLNKKLGTSLNRLLEILHE